MANFIYGNGTESNPYQIWSVRDLLNIGNYPTSHFIQVVDLDLENCKFYPLFSYGAFEGYYNGNKKTINNLKIDATNDAYVGLFSVIRGEGTIENLNLKNVNIIGKVMVGGITGCNEGIIRGCSVHGNIIGSQEFIGGIAGRNDNLIENCFSEVGVGSSTVSSAGGIIGYAASSSKIINSYSVNGTINANSSAGGLIGSCGNFSPEVINCYSANIVSSLESPGGLIGYANSSLIISSSYYDSDISGLTDTGRGEPKTSIDLKDSLTFSDWLFDTIWEIDEGINDGYPSLRSFKLDGDDLEQYEPDPPSDWKGLFRLGNGTVTDPFQIWTKEDLENINSCSAANFIQMRDIDMSPDWTSINLLEGSYNGNNFNISNLVQPLFNTIRDGSVKRLGLIDVNIGSIFGTDSGQISSASSVGALVGSFNSGLIEECFSTGTINTLAKYVGGLIGGCTEGNVIPAIIRNCYSECNVINNYTSNPYTGGFIGTNISYTLPGKLIENCYSLGSVGGVGSNIGGFCGYYYNNGGIRNCFYNSETSNCSDTGKGEPKTTLELKDMDALSGLGWDFSSVWKINSRRNNGFPYCIPKYRGSGTKVDPYRVGSAEDLYNMRENLLAYYRQIDDIDLSGYENWTPIGKPRTANDPLSFFAGCFDGDNYEIKNLTINIDNDSETIISGLFGFIVNATIKNIKIVDCNISIINNLVRNVGVGVIAAVESNSFFKNCSVSGEVYCENAIFAGIVAQSSGDVLNIENCSSDLIIEAKTSLDDASSSISGISIGAENTILNNCCVSGEITGTVTGSDSTLIIAGMVPIFYFGEIKNCLCNITFNSPSSGNFTADPIAITFNNEHRTQIVNSYYNSEKWIDPFSNISFAKTSAQLKLQSTYIDWDFTDIWAIGGSVNDGYPYLQFNKEKEYLFLQGAGIQNYPFEVWTSDDLNAMRDFPSTYFIQMGDIDLTDIDWEPIDFSVNELVLGSSTYYLDGYLKGDFFFNGNGFEISNLKLNLETSKNCKSIGFLGKIVNGVIENVKLVNIDFSITSNLEDADFYIGGLCAESSGTLILKKCSITGSIEVTNTGYGFIGGLIGGLSDDSYMAECYSDIVITGTGSNDSIGGLAGVIRGSFFNCYAVGSITANGKVGGFACDIYTDTHLAAFSYAACQITGNPSSRGGFANYMRSYLDYCYFDSLLSGDPTNSSYVERLDTYEMKRSSTFTTWDFENVWNIDSGVNNGYPHLIQDVSPPYEYAHGNGSKLNPYQVWNFEDLDGVRDYLDAHFIQMDNIDVLSSNWRPIGENVLCGRVPFSFLGSYDGNCFVINRLKTGIRRTAGLFGAIGFFGTDELGQQFSPDVPPIIRNVRILKPNIHAYDNAGAIVGINYFGEILSSYSLGGIARGSCVGGIIGNTHNGMVKDCFSTTTVEGISSWMERTGGLIGSTSLTNIINCYSAGEVVGQYPHGLIGGNYSITEAISSYYDSDITNCDDTEGGAIPKSTAEMKTIETFVDWDFDNIWSLDSTINDGYPYLFTEEIKDKLKGSGTKEDPYRVANAEQLNDVRNNLSAYYIQTADIDLSSYDNWEPIGDIMEPFYGNYNGDFYKIKNLKITTGLEFEGMSLSALFGVCGGLMEDSLLQNIILEDVDISGGMAGALVSYNMTFFEDSGLDIENCCSSGTIYVSQGGGGLIGSITGAKVTDSFSTCTIEPLGQYGPEFVGGLLGVAIEDVTITNCYASGNMENIEYGSGLVGAIFESATIISSYYNSELTGFDGSDDEEEKGIPKTTAEMQLEETYVDWDFEELWILNSDINGGYPYYQAALVERQSPGSGTFDDPYRVYTAEDLDNVRNNTSSHFIQMADIDLIDYPDWVPIGTLDFENGENPYAGMFSGSYDGNGYKISNLSMSTGYNMGEGSLIGLFGIFGDINVMMEELPSDPPVILKNIILENVNIDVGEGVVFATGLACYAIGGTISGCSISGVINCEQDYTAIGGLVGIGMRVMVNDCFSSCSISSNGMIAGSIVGRAEGGIVTNCYANGVISCGMVTEQGVLPMAWESQIISSYYDSDVAGIITDFDENYPDYNVGVPKTTAEMKLQETYVDWDFENIWGLDPEINNGYPHLLISIKAEEAPGLELVSMEIESLPNKLIYGVDEQLDLTGLIVVGTYVDDSTGQVLISINDVTGFDSSQPVEEQVLTITKGGLSVQFTIEIREGFIIGSGTLEDPFHVYSPETLNKVREYPSSYFLQVMHIDLSRFDNWEPIGTIDENFTGGYDGNKFEITGLNIDRPNEDDIGLFGVVSETNPVNLKNIYIRMASVSGRDNVGILVGNSSSNVTGCRVSGIVQGINNLGGLIGSQAGEEDIFVTNSYSNGILIGQDGVNLGGLIGKLELSKLIRCSSSVRVLANASEFVGGLIGMTDLSEIYESSANGIIRGNFAVGGLVGYVVDSKLSRSSALGPVRGKEGAGGFLGVAISSDEDNTGNAIDNCFSTGDVYAASNEDNQSAGGFAGIVEDFTTIRDCYARGKVIVVGSGAYNIGGFIGSSSENNVIVENSYATGLVAGYPGVESNSESGFLASTFSTDEETPPEEAN